MASNGVWLIDAHSMRKERFQPTGLGAHGLYPSRDSKVLYVSNREAGTITLISFRTRRPVRTWRIPGGGSPDMGGVSADGRVLWLSGRYNSEVYAISTVTGQPPAPHPRRQRPPRPVRLAPARALLDRAHGHPALATRGGAPGTPRPSAAAGEVSVTSPPAASARRRASGRPSPAPPWPLTPDDAPGLEDVVARIGPDAGAVVGHAEHDRPVARVAR